MKSHVNDCLEVMQAIYQDSCILCGVAVSDRDLLTIRSRVEEEGFSFLTITLPSFATDFEKSLSQGFIDSKCFRSFRKHQAIPAFLRGMLNLVFNVETGRINDDDFVCSPAKTATIVLAVRQVCLAFKKIKLECTRKRVTKALENFVEIERSFDEFSLPTVDHEEFLRVSAVLWDNIIRDLRVDMLVPRHGPGNTAERISGNSKYAWQYWFDRLEPYFPLVDTAYPYAIGDLGYAEPEELRKVSILPEEEETPVRVTPVPKTLKGPRIIAIEPCCMQYAQQGLRRMLYAAIESNYRTRGHVNFRDQSINQALAIKSSSDGQLATIDLSDASDRVPRSLALAMFNGNPDFRDAIDACRSKTAILPDGTLVAPLRKFASMGSALCFLVEAMYFYTICVVASLRFHNLPVSHAHVDQMCRDIYVYGDDIIVPTYMTPTILDHLRKYNCKVNDRKTFFTGKFRESCGVDAFDGVWVTPLYINRVPPKNRQQVPEILSSVASANLFEQRGMWRTSELLFSYVEKLIGVLPHSDPVSPALGRHLFSPLSRPPRKRWNRHLQRLEVRCWTASPVYRKDPLEGFAALQKCLLRLQALPDLDAQRDHLHLERSALYGAVAIKRRWVPNTLVSGSGPCPRGE
jgi:hypothetical protein